jgi:hypothetical protein
MEILSYLNKNKSLDFHNVIVIHEDSVVTYEKTLTKYLFARTKTQSEGGIKIKTILVDHHETKGITFT